ncbi:MAG TPA: MFS transporter [Vicinamibacterales bacterium]|nr:MFS transporter [Vicinamibacterales bacterium]
MVSTLVLMGASTTAIGLTLTYAQIGIAAPIVLVCLRFLQGLSLGGESAAGPLLAMESAPGNARGLFAAFVSSGAATGTVLGAVAAFAVRALPPEHVQSWAWRLPFIASAPIFAISLYVRMNAKESPIFERALQHAAPERVPLLAVLERCKVPTVQVLLCAMAESSTFYFTSVFGLSYGIQTLKLSNSRLLSETQIGRRSVARSTRIAGAG